MKKINLSVQSPCHEDWNQMHPEEKGRFCASCCKTVTDFTGMSDRQLADFFKKPKEDICGRFYADQLQRDIPITRKRIPWLRYIFQFALPAFVLFLKSCGQKNEVVGDVVSIKEQPMGKKSFLIDGIVEEIKAVHLTERKPLEDFKFDAESSITMEIPIPPEEKIVELRNTVFSMKKTEEIVLEKDTIVMARKDMNTLVITKRPENERRIIDMGVPGVSKEELVFNGPLKPTNVKTAPIPRLFPNPAQAGTLITIVYKEEEVLPDMVQIFTVVGQLVRQEKISVSKAASVFNLNLPSTLKPGMYLIKFTDSKNNHHHTEKLVIQ